MHGCHNRRTPPPPEKKKLAANFFFFLPAPWHTPPSPLNGTVPKSYPSGHSRVNAFLPEPFALTGKEQHVILHLIATVSS